MKEEQKLRKKLRKVISLTATIDPDGSVWGMDTDCGNIEKLLDDAMKIMKKEVQMFKKENPVELMDVAGVVLMEVGGTVTNVSSVVQVPRGIIEQGTDYTINGRLIWSAGEDKDGKIFASTDTRFCDNPDYKCLWVR